MQKNETVTQGETPLLVQVTKEEIGKCPYKDMFPEGELPCFTCLSQACKEENSFEDEEDWEY